MKKIFLVYGHYNDNSFNAAIRDEFVKQSKVNGNQVDVVDLYKEKFDPVFAGEEPDQEVLDHRKRIEESDTIVLIAPIWNFRMPAIVEGWIDKVLAPPWAFRFKQLVGVFHMCGIYNIVYRRYFAVPFVSDAKRQEFLNDVRKTANNL
jgi:NAD(P)H dehydrogenase (quinone)